MKIFFRKNSVVEESPSLAKQNLTSKFRLALFLRLAFGEGPFCNFYLMLQDIQVFKFTTALHSNLGYSIQISPQVDQALAEEILLEKNALLAPEYKPTTFSCRDLPPSD